MGIFSKLFGKKDSFDLPRDTMPPEPFISSPKDDFGGSTAATTPVGGQPGALGMPPEGFGHNPFTQEAQPPKNPFGPEPGNSNPFAQPQQPRTDFSYRGGAPQAPPQARAQGTLHDKDLALISAKLDTIRSQLETISARIERLERLADGSNNVNRW